MEFDHLCGYHDKQNCIYGFAFVDDYERLFLASTAKHYADCKPHISLSCYSLSLPATAKHYATCQFQVSVIRYSYHLAEK